MDLRCLTITLALGITDFNRGLLCLPDQENRLMASVTGQQGMLTPTRHPIPPLVYPVVLGSSATREEELKSLVNRLLDTSESSRRDLGKRGWETINFRGRRDSLSKRGWEALPLYRRRNPYLKRGWESHIVTYPRKRPSLFPFVDTERLPDSVEPSCCAEGSYACCQLCNTGVHSPVLVLNPSSAVREPCQCCDVSEEFCSLCSVM